MRDVIEMAREAGAVFPADGSYHKFEFEGSLERFAALVRADALAEQRTTTENNGGKTGWPPGLLQDDCKGLSKWLANQPDAKRRVREALAEQPAPQPTVPDLIHHTDTSETLEYIQGWNDCRAETLKMRKP